MELSIPIFIMLAINLSILYYFQIFLNVDNGSIAHLPYRVGMVIMIVLLSFGDNNTSKLKRRILKVFLILFSLTPLTLPFIIIILLYLKKSNSDNKSLINDLKLYAIWFYYDSVFTAAILQILFFAQDHAWIWEYKYEFSYIEDTDNYHINLLLWYHILFIVTIIICFYVTIKLVINENDSKYYKRQSIAMFLCPFTDTILSIICLFTIVNVQHNNLSHLWCLYVTIPSECTTAIALIIGVFAFVKWKCYGNQYHDYVGVFISCIFFIFAFWWLREFWMTHVLHSICFTLLLTLKTSQRPNFYQYPKPNGAVNNDLLSEVSSAGIIKEKLWNKLIKFVEDGKNDKDKRLKILSINLTFHYLGIEENYELFEIMIKYGIYNIEYQHLQSISKRNWLFEYDMISFFKQRTVLCLLYIMFILFVLVWKLSFLIFVVIWIFNFIFDNDADKDVMNIWIIIQSMYITLFVIFFLLMTLFGFKYLVIYPKEFKYILPHQQWIKPEHNYLWIKDGNQNDPQILKIFDAFEDNMDTMYDKITTIYNDMIEASEIVGLIENMWETQSESKLSIIIWEYCTSNYIDLYGKISNEICINIEATPHKSIDLKLCVEHDSDLEDENTGLLTTTH